MQFANRNRLILFLVLFYTIPIYGQYNCIFEHLSTENGLPHGTVSAMLKDKQGYMWFATWNGVCRYDGRTFKTFNKEAKGYAEFASKRIEKIKEDSFGNIWVMTRDYKVFRFNSVTEKMELVVTNTKIGDQMNITGISPFSSGDVWLKTKNNGAFRVITNRQNNEFSLIHYHEKSINALPGNNIFFIAEDSRKNIWINTNNGICLLKQLPQEESFTVVSFNDSNRQILDNQIITSYGNSGSMICFGTQSGSLLTVNTKSQQIKVLEFNNDAPVSDISNTYNGSFYIGTKGNGIFEFSEWTSEISRHFNNPTIQFVLKSFVDSKGNLWVESLQAGISKINLLTGTFKHFMQKLDVPADIRNEAQCGMKEDENKTLWLTLKGGGFGYYDSNTDNVEYFYNEPEKPKSQISNFVKCFYKDSTGVLWMSTYFKGIDKITFNQNQFDFKQPAPQHNLSIANEVRAIMEDSEQLTWVGTKKREVYILNKAFTVIKKLNKLNGEEIGLVYTILEDSKGNIYLGTKGNGLFVLKRNGLLDFKVKHFVHKQGVANSLSDNNIYTLFEDLLGRIWIGTYGGGVNLFENEKFINQNNGLINYPEQKGQKVRHITGDLKGNIWIGTTNGLFFVKPTGELPEQLLFNFYSKEQENIGALLSNDIFWILCDKQQRIWVSSLGGGLAQLKKYPEVGKGLEFDVFTKTEGLPSDVIFTLIDDKKGNLWMSTENGISQYQPANKVFKNYSVADGILNSTFSEASVTAHADGRFSFGANKGFYSFNPNGFKLKQQKVNLVFTGFQLFGNEVEPGKTGLLKRNINQTNKIKLKHNQNVFGISWAGLSYKMQNKIQYAYRLKGFDSDWHYTSDQNRANYTKLPAGEYKFEVEYLNPELRDLNKPKSIQIEVLPPFWKTNWAYLLYVVLLLVFLNIARKIAITIIRLRNKVVIEKKLTEIKLNFFTNISHELRTPLSLISGPAKALKEQSEPQSSQYQYAHLIEQNAQRLIRIVTHLLDFRKIQSNKLKLNLKPINLVMLVDKVSKYFNELASEKNIKFKVSCPVTSVEIIIDEDKMESVIFNLLSNAFKFTPNNGKIKLTLTESVNKSLVTIEVKDSGPGVHKDIEDSLFTVFASHNYLNNQKLAGTGIGLALAKELVQLHYGSLTYRKAIKGGAIFSVELPVNNANLKGEPIHKISVGTENAESETMPDFGQAKQGNKPSILVVEDNQELRLFLQMQLADKYQVYEAASGIEGLKMAIKQQPDIVLSDVMMPEMDGIEMLDKMKNNFEISHIPIILLTSKSSVVSKIEALKYGADAYITKPFSTEQLLAQIANLLHQRSLLIEKFASSETGINKENNIGITDKDTEFLNQIREIIEENITNADFKVEWLYKNLGMGRSNFFSKMKSLTGSSPIEFIKTYRLTKANTLLQLGNHNVSEVAYLSGFTDAGYFSKRYKDRFGISPSEVMKSKNN